MQTSKELLSQNEIDALLEVMSTPSEQQSDTKLGFELRMAKVAKSVENYLDGLGAHFDEVKVTKEVMLLDGTYSYEPRYDFLEKITFDNAFALHVIAMRFGGSKDTLMERTLTSLERRLLEDVHKEIAYIVEKELDSLLQKEAVDTKRVLSFFLEGSSLDMELSFTKMAEVDALEVVPDNKTVAEAVIGTLSSNVCEQGALYKVERFEKKSVAVVFDGSLCFSAFKSSKNSQQRSYILQDALTTTEFLSSYYVVVAKALLDDELYITLEKGSTISLTHLEVVEIHKDGKIVAKAQLRPSGDDLVVKIV